MESFANLMSHFQNGGDDLEQILQNERRNLVVDDSIKNDVRLTPCFMLILTWGGIKLIDILDIYNT
jgi:hypothetical protein